jgi:hypothetical protein
MAEVAEVVQAAQAEVARVQAPAELDYQIPYLDLLLAN